MLILKYLQLPFCFDVNLLQQEVAHLSTTSWLLHYQTMHYEGSWSAIPLRSTGGRSDNIIISPTDDAAYEDTVFLKECPYITQVLDTFKCPLKAVRLLKLDAGAVIKAHRDAELNFENGEVRLHIPVVTHEDVDFYLDDEKIMMQEGECWYMNFNLLHRIENRSSVNRIHLVIDAAVNDWVRSVFTDPAVKIKKETDMELYDAATKRQMIIAFRQMNTELGHKMADELERELARSGQ